MIGGRPLLALIDTESDGDGVAHVARLLVRAMSDILNSPAPRVTLSPRSFDHISIGEQARFLASLAWAQSHTTDWVLFGHLGLARAQALVPAPWRRPFGVVLCGVEAWDPSMKAGRLRALRSAGLRLAISEYTATRTRSTHPDVGRISTCPLGLMPERGATDDEAVDHHLLAQIRGPSAVIVGRMSANERYKGHDLLLESWHTVRSVVPDAQLVVVGRGDDADRLRAKAQSLALGHSVLFTGFVADATRAAILEQASCFVLPSSGEGFGLVYLEAMRAGLPCIGSREGPAGEIIVDQQTGLLVDSKDAAGLARGIASLLANSSLARQMGEAGRRRFEAEYTFDRFRARLEMSLRDATLEAVPQASTRLSTTSY